MRSLRYMFVWLLLLCCLAPRLQAATILVLGDSLSAGYGLPTVEQGWVKLLARDLAPRHKVVNASVSGATTADGLTRLPRALVENRPDWVIIALGGNDGLRGLPLAAMQANLRQMVQLCRQAHARVLLVGIELPPNYGRSYTQAFHTVYDRLAQQARLAYVPDLMAGFAGDLRQFQPDGIHPAASAQTKMMQTVKRRLPL
ncbi:arylesterase [Paludibacterium purpuratum]|uniref:Acyl-CoA thioesterase-1 n=1 Tax=Paludibacterium purpuratum TaxID=1144873 RepID=A0A4R7B9C2_9NEIS|nr:arylesterase [Paludibacterium purpuratum]TDR81411.1 acyl-CoA thioesterase-1 [Paludibacterium purpuratum]